MSNWVTLTLTFVSLFVSNYMMGKSINTSFKLLWITIIMAFPIFGGLFYLLLKQQTSVKRFENSFFREESRGKEFFEMNNLCLSKNEMPKEHKLQIEYLQNKTGFPVYKNTKTKYLTPGEVKFKKLVEILESAEKYIFLEYFIISDGILWQKVLEILKQKASQGLEVRIIYDDIGCFLSFPKDYPKKLERMGIKAAIFNPFGPFLNATQNNRDHRKIAIVDGKSAITGGINLADEYINSIKKYGNHWKDSAILLEGAAAWSFTIMFLQMWNICKKTNEDYKKFYPWSEKNTYILEKGYVQPFSDNPLDSEATGKNVYLQIINNAKKYVYINTPYLIIDDSMIAALSLAAKSGVDVRIVTPYYGDKFYVQMLTRSYYKELTESGIKIYEYAEGFIHSKTFVSDDKVATVGTTNLDYRSFYLSFECGVNLYETSSIKEIHEDFVNTLFKCKRIMPEDYNFGILTRISQNFLRLLSPLF